MSKLTDKRTVDMQVIGDWVQPRSKVLDLGCGRGVLLEYLVQHKNVFGTGVDLEFAKITACVRRGIVAYQGDMVEYMKAFPDGHFDRVICSRTLEELQNPSAVIMEALRVGKSLAVGFINHGYQTEWFESRPSNPLSIHDFEHFCATKNIRINRYVHLRGDWKRSCQKLPNFFAGYALYDLSR
jgi:SAM-dependent methyltransferase